MRDVKDEMVSHFEFHISYFNRGPHQLQHECS